MQMDLYSKDGIQFTSIKQDLTHIINGPLLETYLIKKYQWNKEKLGMIDWEAIETTLDSYTPIQHTRMAQLMHNWQNVGKQKIKMNHSDGLCLAGCSVIETHGDYLHCTTPKMEEHQKLLMNTLRLDLKSTTRIHVLFCTSCIYYLSMNIHLSMAQQ